MSSARWRESCPGRRISARRSQHSVYWDRFRQHTGPCSDCAAEQQGADDPRSGFLSQRSVRHAFKLWLRVTHGMLPVNI